MSVRHLVVVASLAAGAALVLPAAPSYAAVTDLYVTTSGDDSNDCTTVPTACATVNAATFKADTTGTTIHVGAGTFDGPVRPGVFGKSVTIDGAGTDTTTLTASETTMGYDGTVVELYGTTEDTLSNLSVSGGVAGGITVADTHVTLHLDHVVATGGGCDLYVTAGTVDAADSTFSDGGAGGCGTPPSVHEAGVALDGGAVSLTHSQVPVSVTNASGLVVNGGSATVDQSYFDGSSNQQDGNQTRGVLVTSGTASVSRSTFNGFDTAVFNSGGSVSASDDTFTSNVEGVTGGTGPTTVVRSTFANYALGAVYGPGPEPVAVAGSVFDRPSDTTFGKNCAGSVSDLGYNLSADGTCGFAGTSKDDVTGLDLDTALADRGGPAGLPTVATFWGSPAVNLIPAGATYGPSHVPLCPTTTASDLRGVPRPQAGACDAGSMELAATATTLTAPKTAKPHADVLLDATVTVPDVGVEGLELPVGTVTFRADGVRLCDVLMDTHSNEATCSTTSLGAGAHSLRATFTPVVGASTLHASTVTRTIAVGTAPAFTSKARATFTVGKTQTFRVRASGSPSPWITLVKGRLPAGLHFHAGTGSARISGTAKASAVGSRSVTLQASNLRGSARQVLRIVVARH